MTADDINKVTGILQLISTLEPPAVQLVTSLAQSTKGKSAAEIAALVHQQAQGIEDLADEEIKKAGGKP